MDLEPLYFDSDLDVGLTGVKRRTTDAPVTAGTCTYSLALLSDDSVVTTGTLAHGSAGNWAGVIESSQMGTLTPGDQVRLTISLSSSGLDRKWNMLRVAAYSPED